jgi:glycerophosphoryl diester phosphodiesterase
MTLLAHRGLWAVASARNTLQAFSDAFANGWGVELDVRDLAGEPVISHDPPAAGALAFGAVVEEYLAHGTPGLLAVNVKADGLPAMLAAALARVPAERWFAFDMSVPDTRGYQSAGLPYYTRHSDLESAPALYDAARGVWLDDFAGAFIDEAKIAAHLDAGKHVAVVSPELHGRDHGGVWSQWRRWAVWGDPRVHLCTDHPLEAQEVFA